MLDSYQLEQYPFLPLQEFFSQCGSSWDILTTRFFKLEWLQAYEEPGDPSYEAFKHGDDLEAARLLKERIEGQAPLYQVMREKGFDFVRVRAIYTPISDYLKYEMDAYRIAEKMGEKIFCFDIDELKDSKLKKHLKDFLIFDNFLMLVQKHTSNGRLEGAWKVEDVETIEQYITIANRLLNISVPFSQFDFK